MHLPKITETESDQVLRANYQFIKKKKIKQHKDISAKSRQKKLYRKKTNSKEKGEMEK